MNTGFDLGTLGRWLVAAGIAFVVIGAALLALMRLGGLEHLPGTICWQTGGATCVVPLLLSLLLSVSLTVVLNLIIQWLVIMKGAGQPAPLLEKMTRQNGSRYEYLE